MAPRRLGRTGLSVSPIGFGAFKIGRNTGVKYARGYDLPSDAEAHGFLNELLDAGITYIDTAPAYGSSEQRIGAALAARRGEFVLSTKVGETFEGGLSTYDFSPSAVAASVERSLKRLHAEQIDILFIHAPANDLALLEETDVVDSLRAAQAAGRARFIGFSGKTVAAARRALDWADVLMIEYNLNDRSHAAVIAEAAARGVGVVVKKGLASGRLDPAESIAMVLGTPGVGSLVIGGLNAEHVRANVRVAGRVANGPRPPSAAFNSRTAPADAERAQ